MNKKAAIYDPYLDTLGGGERYCLTVAEILLKNGYSVDLFWSKDINLISRAQQRFDLEISNINIVPDIFNENIQKIELVEDPISITKFISIPKINLSLFSKFKNIYQKYVVTSQYDLFFYLSDWSIPFLFSPNNILHVQVPFLTCSSKREKLLNLFKIKFLKNIICNSEFTKKYALKQFGHKCRVLYPPVDVEKFYSNTSKENIIMSVGRFDNLLNTKKQDILIEAFKHIHQQNRNTGWKMVLAGGSLEQPEKNVYLQHLKYLSSSYPIEFVINPSFSILKDLYSRSKIYWHAAGYNIDESQHPENTEHFGMAPVEAMASGQVPILTDKGGLPEIIDNNVSGYLWNQPKDLIAKTLLLMATPDRLQNMSHQAKLRSREFSKEKFTTNLLSTIQL